MHKENGRTEMHSMFNATLNVRHTFSVNAFLLTFFCSFSLKNIFLMEMVTLEQ